MHVRIKTRLPIKKMKYAASLKHTWAVGGESVSIKRDGGTSFWDYHLAIAALGLLYYGPVNKAGLTFWLPACYLSTCLFLLTVWPPVALAILKNCDVETAISQHTRDWGNSFRWKKRPSKQGVLQIHSETTRCTDDSLFQGERKRIYDGQYCAILSSNDPNYSNWRQVLGIGHNVTACHT